MVADGKFRGWISAWTFSDSWLDHDRRGSWDIWRLAVASESFFAD